MKKISVTILIGWIACGIMVASIGLGLSIRHANKTNKAVVIRAEGVTEKWWAIKVEEQGKKDDVNLIVLWIDSPGGYVSDAILFSHDLERVRSRINKPIYIYTEYELASGAYWVACSADSIFASPASYVGGIGVFVVRVDLTEVDEEEGVNYYYFYGGEYKLWGYPHVKITLEEMIGYAERIDEIHQTFILRVMWARMKVFKDVLTWQGMESDFNDIFNYTTFLANGELFSSTEAQGNGLIDRVTFFDDLCDDLRARGYIVVKENGKIIENFYEEN